MRALAMIFATICIAFTATVTHAQTAEQLEAWYAQPHCHWRDADGVVRPHHPLTFADANARAMVPLRNGKLSPYKAKGPYAAICSDELFPRGERDCPKGGCYSEADRPAKDCKGKSPMQVDDGPIKYWAGCRHVARGSHAAATHRHR